MIESKDLKLVGSVFDPRKPKDKIVQVKGELYQVHLYLSGKSIPYVSKVVYYLHETFKNNQLTVKRTVENPNCVLSIWTWGLFEVKAIVEDKNGELFELKHQLKWDKELKSDTKYKYVD